MTVKTVLITGAAGDVGQRLAPLLADGYRLRLSDLKAPAGMAPGMEFVPADQIDPLLYSKAYYAEADKSGAKPGDSGWSRGEPVCVASGRNRARSKRGCRTGVAIGEPGVAGAWRASLHS